MAILTIPTQKSLNQLSVFQNQFIPSVYFLRYSPVTRLATPVDDNANPKYFWFCIKMQKMNLFHLFIIQPVLQSCHQIGHTHFLTMLTQKIFDHLWICVNLYQHAKNQLIPLAHSWDTVNFRVHRPDWTHPFFVIPNKKNLDQLLILVNLYQHAKKWGCFIDSFWRNI